MIAATHKHIFGYTMSTFTLPGDLDLAEYASPFDNPDQLAEFILDADNDGEGYTVLRALIFDFTYSASSVFTDTASDLDGAHPVPGTTARFAGVAWAVRVVPSRRPPLRRRAVSLTHKQTT